MNNMHMYTKFKQSCTNELPVTRLQKRRNNAHGHAHTHLRRRKRWRHISVGVKWPSGLPGNVHQDFVTAVGTAATAASQKATAEQQ